MSSIRIEFNWPNSLTNTKTNRNTEGEVRTSLKKFFEHCPNAPAEIKLRIRSIPHRCGPLEPEKNLVVVSPTETNVIIVHLRGTQAISCVTSEDVVKLVKAGPYLKERPVRQSADSEAIADSVKVVGGPPVARHSPDEPTNVVQMPSRERELASATLRQSKRHAVRNELLDRGTKPEEVERIRETVASVVYTRYSHVDPASRSLVVPVTVITEAIMLHMQLEPNETGNYQGVIGSFYSGIIALMATKIDSKLNSTDVYTDWLFDMDIVEDFIGGADEIAALALRRQQAMQVKVRQQASPKPPVTLVQLEATADDLEFLQIAERLIDQHADSTRRLGVEETNLSSLREQLSKLEARVTEVKSAIQAAAARYSRAQAEKRENEIPDEVLDKVRAVHLRTAAILDRLSKK